MDVNSVVLWKNPTDQRETLGTLLRNKEFQVYLVSFPMFLVILMAISFGNFWRDTYYYCVWATYGLVTANYLATVFLGSFILSWILIDQTSWLSKALVFFIVGVCLLVSTIALVIKISFHQLNDDDFHRLAKNHTVSKGRAFWIQVFVFSNLFQGVFSVILSLCLCTVMDVSNLT